MHVAKAMVEFAGTFQPVAHSSNLQNALELLGLTEEDQTPQNLSNKQYGILLVDARGESSTINVEMQDQEMILEIKISKEATPKVWRVKLSCGPFLWTNKRWTK
jgi:hypothetical protein